MSTKLQLDSFKINEILEINVLQKFSPYALFQRNVLPLFFKELIDGM